MKPEPKAEAKSKGSRWSSRRALVLAALVVLLLKQFVPFGIGGIILYPFTLLATWVHEMGHGIMAILAGGGFEKLEIFWDASGLAHTYGTSDVGHGFVAAAGLLAPPIAGAVILAVARGPRRARIVLWVLAGALFVSLALFVRSVLGWAVMSVMVAVIAWINLRWSDNRRLWLAKFVGVLLGLDTITRIDYLFTGGVVIGSKPMPSDIANVATAWGGAYILWGLLLASLSLALVALGIWASWRQPRAAKAAGPAPAKTSRRASGEAAPQAK